MIYDKKGEYDKELEYLNKSLNILHQSFPENHPDFSLRYNNIGII